MTDHSELYKKAGVDIDTADILLNNIKDKIKTTRRPEVISSVGRFAGLFALDLANYHNPVLVSSVDGVGSKLLLASMMNRHESIGHDLVHHCVNDIASQGAEPLYFQDYLGVGKLRSELFETILNSLIDACKAQDIALLGGETAEMPDMYGTNYDLVGCITGVVEKEKVITGASIQAGDIVLALASNGLHTNGYSLARMILFDRCGYQVDSMIPTLDAKLGDCLLEPHLSYWPAIHQATKEQDVPIHGIAHITGGGLYGNLPRVLPSTLAAHICREDLPVPAIFRFLQEKGEISDREMYRVFNMGIGMVWILPASVSDAALTLCREEGFTAIPIGEIRSGTCTVKIRGIDE